MKLKCLLKGHDPQLRVIEAIRITPRPEHNTIEPGQTLHITSDTCNFTVIKRKAYVCGRCDTKLHEVPE